MNAEARENRAPQFTHAFCFVRVDDFRGDSYAFPCMVIDYPNRRLVPEIEEAARRILTPEGGQEFLEEAIGCDWDGEEDWKWNEKTLVEFRLALCSFIAGINRGIEIRGFGYDNRGTNLSYIGFVDGSSVVMIWEEDGANITVYGRCESPDFTKSFQHPNRTADLEPSSICWVIKPKELTESGESR